MPNNVSSQYLGSFIGIILTFTALYTLEEMKKNAEPKSKLKISFSEDEVIYSDRHIIFSPKKQINIKFGSANYLRVKVTNDGDKLANGCRGYLKPIEHKVNGEFIKLRESEGSMRLLWAYEQKEDYRSTNTEQIPSKASEYLDILVSYDHVLKPEDLSKDENIWFLKLKTQPQPLKYAHLLRIDRGSGFEYKLTIEVYADGCDPATLCLILKDGKRLDTIDIFPGENSSVKIPFALIKPIPTLKIPDGFTDEELYDLL